MCNLRYRVQISSLMAQYRLFDAPVYLWYMRNTLNKNNHSIKLCRPHKLAIDKAICRGPFLVTGQRGHGSLLLPGFSESIRSSLALGMLRMQNLKNRLCSVSLRCLMKLNSSKSRWLRDGCTQLNVQLASRWPDTLQFCGSYMWFPFTQQRERMAPWAVTPMTAVTQNTSIMSTLPSSLATHSPSAMSNDLTGAVTGDNLEPPILTWNLEMMLCLCDPNASA